MIVILTARSHPIPAVLTDLGEAIVMMPDDTYYSGTEIKYEWTGDHASCNSDVKFDLDLSHDYHSKHKVSTC